MMSPGTCSCGTDLPVPPLKRFRTSPLRLVGTPGSFNSELTGEKTPKGTAIKRSVDNPEEQKSSWRGTDVDVQPCIMSNLEDMVSRTRILVSGAQMLDHQGLILWQRCPAPEPRFAGELPPVPPLPFRRGVLGRGVPLGVRCAKRVSMSWSSLPGASLIGSRSEWLGSLTVDRAADNVGA